MTIEIMIDLETLGTKPGSVIVAVAAVTSTGSEFYRVIEPQSCIEVGLKMDVSTVQWWMQQSAAAREIFAKDHPREPLMNVLRQLYDGVGLLRPADKDLRFWGNSAAFDLGLLGEAYDAVGLSRPWKFWEESCYRTLKNVRRDVAAPAFEGTQHNALADARHQMRHLSALLTAVRP